MTLHALLRGASFGFQRSLAITNTGNIEPFIIFTILPTEPRSLPDMPSTSSIKIIFPSRKNWVVGVRTKLVDGNGVTYYSAISWSYNPEVVYDIPFSYVPLGLTLPKFPEALKDLDTLSWPV